MMSASQVAKMNTCKRGDMDVDRSTALSSVYKGKKYYFCMPGHKEQFDAAPEKFVKTS
jgi:YHS domain-containing protein